MSNENTIYIGSDHAGFELKSSLANFLKKRKYDVVDVGPNMYNEEDDYTDYAISLCSKVLKHGAKGILICGTGQGMDRAANKIPGIYASVCWDEISAHVAKEHGNINVLCLGGRTINLNKAKKIVDIWFESKFSNKEKHARRVEKIKNLERKYMRQK